MSRPYFITWTKQKEAYTLELEAVSAHSFKDGKSNTLIDLSSMSYQASFGLKNKTITDAIKNQINQFSIALPKHTFPLKDKVANFLNEKAKRTSPSGKILETYKTFFTLSGAEGIENALKMARQVTGKNIILARKRSYHGATMGALSVTGDWRNEGHLLPRQWTVRIPGPDEDPKGELIESIILKHGAHKIAAFCLETVTGGNGVIIATPAYYKKVQALAKRYDIKIIMDEVVCGVYRTGTFFGIDHYPFLRPDFIVMAKALTGGFFPMGALLVNQKIAQYYDKNTLSCGLTNYAHPLGLAAIDAVLEISESKKFQENLSKINQQLESLASELKSNSFIVRQMGALMAIELPINVKQEQLISIGLYISIINQTMIVAPHLNMDLKLLATSLKKLKTFLLKENSLEI